MSRIQVWFLLLVFLAIAVFHASFGRSAVSGFQEFVAPVVEGSLSGTVKDADGTPIGGAVVRAFHTDTGIATIALTDSGGGFSVPHSYLRMGKYEVSGEKKGYRPGASRALTWDGASKKVEWVLTRLPIIPVSQMSSADILPYLPEAPERATTVQTCGACHGLNRLFEQGRTRSEWAQVVERMSSYLPVNEKSVPLILDYLSRFAGPDTTLPQELGEKVRKGYRQEARLGSDLIYTEYDIPTPHAEGNTAVRDREARYVWFSEYGGHQLGRLELATGKITEYPIKATPVRPHGLAIGADGIVWCAVLPDKLVRMDPKTEKMDVLMVPLLPDGRTTGPHTIIVAKSGKVFFTEQTAGSISSFDPATHEFRRYPIQDRSGAYGLYEHGDRIFFSLAGAAKIGWLHPGSGEVKLFPVPTRNSGPQRLRFDAKGRMWFGERAGHKLGMFDPVTETITEYDLPSFGSPYSIHIDGRGYIWLGAYDRDSLLRVDPETKDVVEYPLPGVGVILREIWPDDDGTMWFLQYARNKVTSAKMLPGVPHPKSDTGY